MNNVLAWLKAQCDNMVIKDTEFRSDLRRISVMIQMNGFNQMLAFHYSKCNNASMAYEDHITYWKLAGDRGELNVLLMRCWWTPILMEEGADEDNNQTSRPGASG